MNELDWAAIMKEQRRMSAKAPMDPRFRRRNVEIYEPRRGGKSLGQTAREYRISKTRVE
jgi:hypothetical protein